MGWPGRQHLPPSLPPPACSVTEMGEESSDVLAHTDHPLGAFISSQSEDVSFYFAP